MGRGDAFHRFRRAAEGSEPAQRGTSLAVLGAVGLGALALAGCGSAQHFANIPRPPIPVTLTVFVDNNHVSVSPDHVGGGPLLILVTNESSGTQDVTLARTGGGSGRSSGDINSDATADIQASVTQGSYELRAGANILAAKLTVTHERQNADNALLQP